VFAALVLVRSGSGAHAVRSARRHESNPAERRGQAKATKETIRRSVVMVDNNAHMKKILVLVCAVVVGLASPGAQGKRFITEKDLFKFTWIADPQISPDGSAVAFVRVTVNEKDDKYETSLFAVPASGAEPPRRLTSGSRDTAPRWAPDGKQIAFVRAVEKDGKVQPAQIHLLHMDGGEARPLTEIATGAANPVWSPDGKALAFTSATGGGDGKTADGAKAADEHKSDVEVVTRAVYRSNGNPGYVDTVHHSHIFTISDVGSDTRQTPMPKLPTPRQLTDGEFSEGGVQWAPDGSKLYFVSTRVAEPYYTEAGDELFSVPAGGGPIAKVASIDGQIANISVAPDGRKIAFVGTLRGTPIRSYSQSDLWLVDLAVSEPRADRSVTTRLGTNDNRGLAPRNLTADYDFDIAGGIGGDQSAPRGQNRKPIVWSQDATSLLVVSAEKGSSNLKRVAIATGKVEPFTAGDQDVVAFSATPDASTIAATLSTQLNIGDIFMVGGADKAAPRRITMVNEPLFKDIQQSQPEEIWYKSFDGKNIQGWILKPPDFDASKKYPLILEIHGGPHSAYGNTYTHEFMWMAAKGYVVLFTNPRGSTTYGQDFGNIIQYHYPGDDYKDLMAGVDEVLKKGYIDADRLGVTGGSGGGLLTNWTITQTQRFKAAVAQRDIADWYGFWFTADFTLFQPTWFRKAPWEDPQDFAARSPITHVANVTTPLMLVNGDADYRTPPSDGGEMMFRALKYRKIPTVMVRFPRETHELSRSGEPWHRVERLQHIVGWMDQWLQGKKNAAYARTAGLE
jgi:dipeptidyl aminopeptidase/acylaminoacyl peptidase